ncbi:MAG: PDZ domain-containing protein [Clostridia bacterium]|nr:PDZ domain-containing protein [Clostridia bacterium]
MKKRIPLGMTLALIMLAVALSISLTMVFAMDRFSSTVNSVNKRQAMFDYLTEVDKAARQNYAGEIDEPALQERLAEAYITGIGDPYAGYLTADEYAEQLQHSAGTAEGFGIELSRLTVAGDVAVASVDEGSPAALAGVAVGDIVTAINDTEITADTVGLSQALSALHEQTKVLLTVCRGEKKQAFDLTRSAYAIVSVSGKVVKDNIGYIRVSTFNDATAEQFYSVFDSLTAKKVTSFIFDLRGNEGGSLDIAAEITGYLLPRGTFAHSTASDGTVTPLSSASAHELTVPTVTLVDYDTSGEAELMVGALRQFSLTTVVGASTAGRARVQSYFPISSDNAAVKLSVAELSLVDGGSWEGVGITPDETVALPDDAPKPSLLTEETDTQLKRATEILQATMPEVSDASDGSDASDSSDSSNSSDRSDASDTSDSSDVSGGTAATAKPATTTTAA